ncbi:MAG: putative monovalent cation/H+ antiporter subunit A [Anaerolineales bacterium]|nr:putative monovalent cation/H+ antiporter subunit A [Anaerolineales bacterium]
MKIKSAPLNWLLALLPLSLTLFFASYLPRIQAGELISWRWDWVPALNVSASFQLDGLSLLLALLVAGMGTLVVIYAGGYLYGDPDLGRFNLILLVFMLAMLGVVLADNIIILFIFWELTSISSYLLIGFRHREASARAAASQALLVTGGGGLAMLAGLVLLALAGGSWELSGLLGQAEQIAASSLYLPAVILLFAGAFTKSAQFPFHFWLPNAMAAPTPVSAYLHSATMVKAGVYLLARLTPILGQTEIWTLTLTIVGATTALVGGWLAWQQLDLKKIMAYSTISALGTLVFLLGIGTKLAFEAMALFLLVHSLYKGALFMAAGAIDHEAGTRDISKLGGLARLMPWTLAAVFLAALSQAGIPPLLGFISKELVYETTLETGNAALLTAVALLVNVFLVFASAIILVRPFFGRTQPEGEHIHEAPASMWLGPLLLGLLALLLALFPALVDKPIIGPAATVMYGSPVEAYLYLFPSSLTEPFLLSLVTLAAGLGLFGLYSWGQRPVALISAWQARMGALTGAEIWYERLLNGLLWGADRLTRFFQNGHLRYYLMTIFLFAVALISGTLYFLDGWQWPANLLRPEPFELLIVLIMIGATAAAVRVKSRLHAVAALGFVGFSMALLFIFYGAPDLAMTQFAIETLTVVLFVLVLYRLPPFSQLTTRLERRRDAIIALTVGALMTTLVIAATAITPALPLSDYFTAESWPAGKGLNIVNVILVDFRGLDTLIEIAVLAVAALGVYGLLKLKPASEEESDER